jgi:hypothetical protein
VGQPTADIGAPCFWAVPIPVIFDVSRRNVVEMQKIGAVESTGLPAGDGASAELPIALQARRQIETAPCGGFAELSFSVCDIDRFPGAPFLLRLASITPVSMAQHPDLPRTGKAWSFLGAVRYELCHINRKAALP